VVTATAAVGLGWLVLGYALRVLGLPKLDYPRVGEVPLPTLLLLGGLLVGVLTTFLVHPIIRHFARRARRRAENRLRTAVTDVGREYVIVPVRGVLQAYAQAREALTAARSPR
jgi:hypothetical protein